MPILRQCVMDSSGATGRRHRRQETGHDAVSGVLYLAATKGPQGIPDNLVMDLQKGHGRLVAMELRELCRPHDIRKHDRPDSGIAVVLPAAGKECGARTANFSSPKETLGDFGCYFDNLGREQAMRLTMHRGCRLRIRRSAQAEDLAAALIEPVFMILDAVLLLSFHVRAVCLRHLSAVAPGTS